MKKITKNYIILRFYFGKSPKIVKKGLTQKEAIEWCSNPNTQKIGKYYDGWTKDKGQYKGYKFV